VSQLPHTCARSPRVVIFRDATPATTRRPSRVSARFLPLRVPMALERRQTKARDRRAADLKARRDANLRARAVSRAGLVFKSATLDVRKRPDGE